MSAPDSIQNAIEKLNGISIHLPNSKLIKNSTEFGKQFGCELKKTIVKTTLNWRDFSAGLKTEIITEPEIEKIDYKLKRNNKMKKPVKRKRNQPTDPNCSRLRRAALVKKIMKERDVKMINASKIIKTEYLKY